MSTSEDREIVLRIPYSMFCVVFAQLQAGPFNLVVEAVNTIATQAQPQLDAWQRDLQAEQAAAQAVTVLDPRH